MKTKELDSQNLGPKEDWLGNNAAFECPLCSKVYIASAFLKSERPCPGCGKSRARVTGSEGKGGKAIVTWDDTPAFTVGRKYSREQISAVLGGSKVDFLPTDNKRVVCGCFTPECNPQAPDVILPGTGKVIERAAKLFCKQDYPVPIFIKRRPNEWEYVGDYKAVRFSTAPTKIAEHHNGSITPLNEVTRVIFLKRATML
jgi:uncharacterized protein DUF6697